MAIDFSTGNLIELTIQIGVSLLIGIFLMIPIMLVYFQIMKKRIYRNVPVEKMKIEKERMKGGNKNDI